MPLVRDPVFQQDAVVMGDRPELDTPVPPEEPKPGMLDTLAAAARTGHVVGAAYQWSTTQGPRKTAPTPPGWDPFDNIPVGMEKHAYVLGGAKSPEEMQGMAQRIKDRQRDLDVLRRAGVSGVFAELAFGITDPSFLVVAGLPEVSAARNLTRTVMATRTAVEGVLGAATYEAAMQGLQEDRSFGEGLLNVGAAGVMSGVLGSLIRQVPKDELGAVRDALEAEIRDIVQTGGSTAGAAQVKTGTLEDLTIARGGQGLSKTLSKTPLLGTDLDVTMQAASPEARELLMDMADVPVITNQNLRGVRTPDSAEAAMGRHEGRVANFIDYTEAQYAEYAKRVARGERMNKGDFGAAVARAARNKDTVGIPEVDAAARKLRAEVFDPLWTDAKALGLYTDPVKAAQERETKKAVGKYVKAESRQIYADYAAGKNAGIKYKGFVEMLAEEARVPGSAGSAAVQQAADELAGIKFRAAQVTDRLTQAMNTIEQSRAVGLSKAATMADDALKAFEKQMASLQVPGTPETLAPRGFLSLRKLVLDAKKSAEEALQANRDKWMSVKASPESTPAEVRKAREAYKLEAQKLRAEYSAKSAEIRAQFKQAMTEAKLAVKNAESKDLRRSAKLQVKAVQDLNKKLNAIRVLERDERRAAAEAEKAARQEASAEQKDLRRRAAKIKSTAYKEYAKPGQPLTRRQFLRAAKRGDSTDEQIQKMSKLLRDRDAGALASRVYVPEVDPRYIKQLLADDSYFTRMYDRTLIRDNLDEWKATLVKWFTRSSNADEAEIRAAVDDVTDTILGTDVGLANFNAKISTPKAGPLNERTLDIPSNMIEQFLVNDPTKIARAYTRELAPQVELAKRGLTNEGFAARLQQVKDRYNILAAEAEQTLKGPELKARLKELSDEGERVMQRLKAVRLRVLGKAWLMDPNASRSERLAVQAARGWRNWVGSVRLGATAVTGGMMDLAKITAHYGFMPTMGKMVRLATSPVLRDYVRKEGRRAGAVIEVALSKRVTAVAEGAMTEGWTDRMVHGVYKYTGLNHIMDFNRTLAAAMFEDEVIRMAKRVQKGLPLPAYKRAKLASLGLGDTEMKQIAEMVAKHGGQMDGVNVSGSALWDHPDNVRLGQIYDSAILKDSHITVQQPGAADRVWWMDSETGKLLGQLKSFALSAPSRLTTQGLQMFGNQGALEGARYFGYMLMGGYLTHAIRQLAAGREPTSDPAKALNEAIVESGTMGVLPDLVSAPIRQWGARFGLETSARYSDRDPLATYGGPAVGQVKDVWDAQSRMADGKMTQNDLHALRRTLIPGQNIWWLRRAINALEGETGEAMGLEGSTTDTFLNRMAKTEEAPK